MEAYESEGLKSEKAGAILLYHNLKCVAKLFRIVEIFVVLVFLSWTSTHLPLAVKISSDYFRQLIAVIISPFFTFLLCNAIVLTLLLKAGDFFVGQSPADVEIGTDPYGDFVNAGHDGTGFSNAGSSPVPDPDEVEFEDKETIYEESNNTTIKTGDSDDSEECGGIPVKFREAEVAEFPESKTEITTELKDLRRSQSEKLMMESMEKKEKTEGKLRRSETEKFRKVSNPCDFPEEAVYVFDELSNDEFQRTIETFIAKQIKFHQEEKLAIVLSSHA